MPVDIYTYIVIDHQARLNEEWRCANRGLRERGGGGEWIISYGAHTYYVSVTLSNLENELIYCPIFLYFYFYFLKLTSNHKNKKI